MIHIAFEGTPYISLALVLITHCSCLHYYSAVCQFDHKVSTPHNIPLVCMSCAARTHSAVLSAVVVEVALGTVHSRPASVQT